MSYGSCPVIILVRPQLGENIGAGARAMLNFGFTDLRLVAPRDGWPNLAAEAPAAGAEIVLKQAIVFDSVEEAIQDLDYVYAATARPRHLIKEVFSIRSAAEVMNGLQKNGQKVGVLFGPERAGLENEDLVLANAFITADLNPGFSSLNLSQSIGLVAYEYFQSTLNSAVPGLKMGKTRHTTKKEILNFYRTLSKTLKAQGYFRGTEKSITMDKNLKNLFHRLPLTHQDIQTLYGVLRYLTHPAEKK